MCDRLAMKRLRQHIKLIAGYWPWINNGHLAFADHIQVGALEGKGARIRAYDAPKSRKNLLQRAVLENHITGKGRRLRGLVRHRQPRHVYVPASQRLPVCQSKSDGRAGSFRAQPTPSLSPLIRFA